MPLRWWNPTSRRRQGYSGQAGRVFQREPARSTTDYPEHTDKTKDNEQKFSADSADEIPGPTFLVFIRGKLFRRLGLIRGKFV